MTVAVISTAYREADILNAWIGHVLAERVDLVLVALKLSDDISQEILDNWKRGTNDKVDWVEDTESSHRQAWWTNRLADMAYERGADFILPADVDEFPYALSGETVGAALDRCEHDKLFMQVWPHRDWDNRFVDPHRMPKVAYRWSPDARVVMGSHDVSLPGGEHDILAMREWQYRGFDHFVQKAHDRNETLESDARARGDGWHHLRLEGLSREQMEAEWSVLSNQPTVFDPVPTHYPSASLSLSGVRQN